MEGSTTSLKICQFDAPANRAVCKNEGGTEASAALESNMENAVPRQILKTIMDNNGYSRNHSVSIPRIVLSVPSGPLSMAIQRNVTTELGIIQARITTNSIALRYLGAKSRIVHAIKNPRRACPKTAEPRTNSTVTRMELRKSGSVKALVKFSRPTNCGEAASTPVSR